MRSLEANGGSIYWASISHTGYVAGGPGPSLARTTIGGRSLTVSLSAWLSNKMQIDFFFLGQFGLCIFKCWGLTHKENTVSSLLTKLKIGILWPAHLEVTGQWRLLTAPSVLSGKKKRKGTMEGDIFWNPQDLPHCSPVYIYLWRTGGSCAVIFEDLTTYRTLFLTILTPPTWSQRTETARVLYSRYHTTMLVGTKLNLWITLSVIFVDACFQMWQAEWGCAVCSLSSNKDWESSCFLKN